VSEFVNNDEERQEQNERNGGDQNCHDAGEKTITFDGRRRNYQRCGYQKSFPHPLPIAVGIESVGNEMLGTFPHIFGLSSS
jgi:hypothetical protein